MKFTFAILSLAAFYCTVNAASIGNANELDPLVKSVTTKITSLAKTLETTTPVKKIIDASEDIINAAQVLISETSDLLDDEDEPNSVNEKDEEKVDILQFIASNALSAEEVVHVLFADEQLDDWRAVLLMRSLILGREGLQFEFDQFKSASTVDDNFHALRNIRVWCQAISRISEAFISTANDAELTLRAQVGLFDDDEEQEAPSSEDLDAVLAPGESDSSEEISDKRARKRRAFWSSGPWSVGTGGATYSSGRHSVNAGPTFTGGFGGQVTYTYRF